MDRSAFGSATSHISVKKHGWWRRGFEVAVRLARPDANARTFLGINTDAAVHHESLQMVLLLHV
jgi:hypothetical protein